MPATKDKSNSPIGRATKRIDGPLKVTGQATYTSDHNFPGLLHAVPVGATIANGSIAKLDTKEAESMPGVRGIFHRGNLGKLFRVAPNSDYNGFLDEERPPFEDDIIRYYGQYVAVAVADTFEQATAAAEAVKVSYNEKKPNVDTHLAADTKIKPSSRPADAIRILYWLSQLIACPGSSACAPKFFCQPDPKIIEAATKRSGK